MKCNRIQQKKEAPIVILKTLALPKIFILGAMTLFILSACGIKPGELSPPDAQEPDRYPAVYPNPATDPTPGHTQKDIRP
jgi:hypothetical protein